MLRLIFQFQDCNFRNTVSYDSLKSLPVRKRLKKIKKASCVVELIFVYLLLILIGRTRVKDLKVHESI